MTGSAIGRRWAAVCRPPPHPGVMGTAPSAELLARTDALIAERDRVRDALVSGGYDVGVSQSNFIWLPLGERSAEFASGAAEQGVLLRSYGNDGVRITIGDPHENDAFLKFALQS